jgi:hypothetical protein
MPTLTLTVSYDGSDPEITQALARMVSALGKDAAANGIVQPTIVQPSTTFDKTATKFAGYVSRRPRLLTVITVWLRSNGKIPLTELVKASGVQKQHDYSGIGSALTRNMKKAGGPKQWYDGHELPNGEWIYEVADELIEPLKKAFNL